MGEIMEVAETDQQVTEIDQPSSPIDTDEDQFALLRAFAPVVVFLIASAALSAGREVLLPLAMAIILAVIFSPVATRLERYLGRLLSAAIVVCVVVGLMRAMVYFLTVELTTVADHIAGYSDNIGNKLAALEKTTPPWLQHIQKAVADVEQRLERANPSRRPSRGMVQAVPIPSTLRENLKPFFPALAGLVHFLFSVSPPFFPPSTQPHPHPRPAQ